jgi:hypothetical protein
MKTGDSVLPGTALKLLQIILPLISLLLSPANAETGDTTVCRWKYNTLSAFTMCFDDSMETHVSTAMPALIARGLVGTWFINPGMSRHRDNRKFWESVGPMSGQEYANHTWTHSGVRNMDDADFQIGECARYIWNLRGKGRSEMMAFAGGGGTTWDISDAEIRSLLNKYSCVLRTSELSARTDLGVDGPRLINKARQAIEEGRWVSIHFHGIGGQWLSIDTKSFIQLLDFLAENKDKIWSAGWSAAYQYARERDNARIDILEQTDNIVRIRLTTALNPELYAEPLTLVTEVPDNWTNVKVIQDGRTAEYKVGGGKLQYEALPDRDIVLQRLTSEKD